MLCHRRSIRQRAHAPIHWTYYDSLPERPFRRTETNHRIRSQTVTMVGAHTPTTRAIHEVSTCTSTTLDPRHGGESRSLCPFDSALTLREREARKRTLAAARARGTFSHNSHLWVCPQEKWALTDARQLPHKDPSDAGKGMEAGVLIPSMNLVAQNIYSGNLLSESTRRE